MNYTLTIHDVRGRRLESTTSATATDSNLDAAVRALLDASVGMVAVRGQGTNAKVVRREDADVWFHFSRYCGAFVGPGGEHFGMARCYCGWAASGGNGIRELEEMGEVL